MKKRTTALLIAAIAFLALAGTYAHADFRQDNIFRPSNPTVVFGEPRVNGAGDKECDVTLAFPDPTNIVHLTVDEAVAQPDMSHLFIGGAHGWPHSADLLVGDQIPFNQNKGDSGYRLSTIFDPWSDGTNAPDTQMRCTPGVRSNTLATYFDLGGPTASRWDAYYGAHSDIIQLDDSGTAAIIQFNIDDWVAPSTFVAFNSDDVPLLKGDSTTIKVAVDSNVPYQVRWVRNGKVIANEYGCTLVVNDFGTYSPIVTTYHAIIVSTMVNVIPIREPALMFLGHQRNGSVAFPVFNYQSYSLAWLVGDKGFPYTWADVVRFGYEAEMVDDADKSVYYNSSCQPDDKGGLCYIRSYGQKANGKGNSIDLSSTGSLYVRPFVVVKLDDGSKERVYFDPDANIIGRVNGNVAPDGSTHARWGMLVDFDANNLALSSVFEFYNGAVGGRMLQIWLPGDNDLDLNLAKPRDFTYDTVDIVAGGGGFWKDHPTNPALSFSVFENRINNEDNVDVVASSLQGRSRNPKKPNQVSLVPNQYFRYCPYGLVLDSLGDLWRRFANTNHVLGYMNCGSSPFAIADDGKYQNWDIILPDAIKSVAPVANLAVARDLDHNLVVSWQPKIVAMSYDFFVYDMDAGLYVDVNGGSPYHKVSGESQSSPTLEEYLSGTTTLLVDKPSDCMIIVRPHDWGNNVGMTSSVVSRH